MILSVSNLYKSFGVNEILKDINFGINKGEKVAIIGVNGAGKTTLFKILTKEENYDSGIISYSKDIGTIGFLSQMLDLDEEKTIYETFIEVFEDLINLENEIRNLEKEMATKKNSDLEKIMIIYSNLTHEFEEKKGYEYKSRIRGVIKGLGFSDDEEIMKLYKLSGGQKSRVSLGKLLLSNPDLLLLDEPTNHLDIESIEWLEEYLNSYENSILLISHDRYFINKIANKIIEIENKKLSIYNGNYNFYVKQKEVNREIQLKHYLKQQKEIERQKKIIRKFRSFATENAIIKAKSKEKLLEKIELVDKPETLPDVMRFSIQPFKESGNNILDVENLSKKFDNITLFENINFDIKKGDKIALVGPNGAGKTTLIKIILNELEKNSGNIKFGTNVLIGYYDQEQENLDYNKTVFETISDAYPQLTNLEIRKALASFIFKGDDVFKKVSMLSGGEKGRLSLTKILLSKSNFLILDEPTNHLDIFSKEILEDTIRNYTGTILYISHDRYFINNTATKIIELKPTESVLYLGDYDYYIEKRYANLIFNEINIQKEDIILKKPKINPNDSRKIKTRIRNIENEITELEIKNEKLNNEILLPEVSTNHEILQEKYTEQLNISSKLENLISEWESLSETLQ